MTVFHELKIGKSAALITILSKFTQALLTIPISNANCERIFSVVHLKIIDKRNSLSNISLTNELIGPM